MKKKSKIIATFNAFRFALSAQNRTFACHNGSKIVMAQLLSLS